VRKLAINLRAVARNIVLRRRAPFVFLAVFAIVSVQAGIVWAGDAAPTTNGIRAAGASQTGAMRSEPALPKQVGHHVLVGRSYKNDASRPLRVVPAVAYKPSEERATIPTFKIHHSRANAPDAARQTKAFAPKMPSPILNFDGITFPGVNCFCAPPDTNGEVGLTQYVQIVNQGFEVFNKTTGASVFGPVDIATLWSGFGGVCEDDAFGDPVVLYDQLANRWVISQFAGLDTYGAMTDECVAVSTTSDATGSWNRYGFHLGTDFFDYPKFGVWPDAYYMSMNVFNSSGTAFLGPEPFAFDRAAMLAGNPATFITFRDPSFFQPTSDQFMPADLDGLNPPLAGAPNPFMSTGTNATWPLYRFHVDFATPANSTFASGGILTPTPFSPICGGGACVPQLGGELLDTLGDRGMFRSAYRNYGDHEALVGNMTIASGGVAGVRWFEVNNATSGTPAFTQEGTQQPDNTWRWMGSAAMDNDGDLAVGYSASSGSISPQIRYAGRLSNDLPGQLAQGEATFITPTSGSQTNTSHRWGDYSDMTVDPVDDCTFWYTQEYYATPGATPFNWNTRIGNFKFPSCTSPSVAHVTVAKTADEPSVFEGNQIGFTVELANDGHDAATGLTFTDNLPGGTGVDWSIDTSDPGWSVTGSAPQTLTYTPTTLAGGTATQVHVVSSTTNDSCGRYTNTASFTSTNGGSGNASDSTTVGCVTIAKTADAPSVSAGTQIGFTVTLTNVSPNVDAAGVTVTDPLPAGTGVDWSLAAPVSGWSLNGSPPNETLAYSATLAHNSPSQVHVVSQTGSQSCGDYFNTASFTTTDEGSGQASDVESVFGCPYLAIYKAADVNSVAAGAPMGFYVEVDNFGDGAATGLTITDPLPSGNGVYWAVDGANSTPGWSVSGAPPNQSLVFSPTSLGGNDFVYVHIVSATSGASCGTYNNTAQFGSSNAGTGSSSDSVSVVGCALFHTLTVNKSGSGAGAVTSSPPGVDCGSVCSFQFNNGLAVTLTAAASSGSRFTGWSGDCSGTAPCALTMSADHNVTATFAKRPKCHVPKVVGLPLTKARTRISKAHCRVGKIKKKTSSKKKKGKVLAQSPKPGKTLANGAKVNLTVGKGPKK
jgi:uncharacterized repeat protein (TIGR01451 family)